MINLRKNNYSIFKIIFIILIFISFNLFAKEEKFESSGPWFYETPTRFIIVVDNGSRGIKCTKNVGCANAYYYEINKQTGKSLKLKGTTINIGPDLDFKGYIFTDKNVTYRIILQGDDAFVIDKRVTKKEVNTILEEPIIEY